MIDEESQEYMTEGQRLAQLRRDRGGAGLRMTKAERSALGRALVRQRGKARGGRLATVVHRGAVGEHPVRGCRCVGCRKARGER